MAKTAAAPAVSSDRTYAGIGYDKGGYEYVDPDVPWAEDDDWWNDPNSWFDNLEYDLWDYDEEDWSWGDTHDGAMTPQVGDDSTVDGSHGELSCDPWDDPAAVDYRKGKRRGKGSGKGRARIGKGKSKGKGGSKGKAKGKGKGKGPGKSADGCSACGSPHHNAQNCPITPRGGGRGGGKTKGRGKKGRRRVVRRRYWLADGSYLDEEEDYPAEWEDEDWEEPVAWIPTPITTDEWYGLTSAGGAMTQQAALDHVPETVTKQETTRTEATAD